MRPTLSPERALQGAGEEAGLSAQEETIATSQVYGCGPPSQGKISINVPSQSGEADRRLRDVPGRRHHLLDRQDTTFRYNGFRMNSSKSAQAII